MSSPGPNASGKSGFRTLKGRRGLLEILPTGAALTSLKTSGKRIRLLERRVEEARGDAASRGGVAALRNVLERGLIKPGSELAVSLPRHLAIVKWIKLPRAPEAELPGMVAFQAEKLIPFPLKKVSLAWQKSGETEDGGILAVLVAVERSVVDAYREVLDEAGCHLRLLTISSLAAARAAVAWGGGIERPTALLVRLDRRIVELDVLREGQHRFGRAAAMPAHAESESAWLQRIATEIRRTEGAYRNEGGEPFDEIVAYGPLAGNAELVSGLGQLLDRPCRGFHLEGLGAEAHELPIALGTLLVGDLRCADLLSGLAAKKPPSRAPWLVGLLCLVLFGLGFLGYRRIDSLERRVEELQLEYDRVASEAHRYRAAEKEVEALRQWTEGRAKATLLLHTLSVHLPEQVYLRALSYQEGLEVRLDASALDLAAVAASPAALSESEEIESARYVESSPGSRDGETVYDFHLEVEMR